MYSALMMMALSGAAAEPACFGGGCWGGGCYGGCYGGCWGSCHGGCWGSSCGGGCWGSSGGGCCGFRSWSHGCHGGCYGGCYGGGYGGCQGSCHGGVIVTPGTQPPPPPKKDTKPDKKKDGADLGNSSRVIVEVPVDAKVYVDGIETKQTNSSKRSFISPPLTPGENYVYDVKVEVTRDGKLLTEIQQVKVRAGEETRAVFNRLTTPATASTVAWW